MRVAPYRNLGAAAKVRLDMDESPARDPYSGSAAWQGLAVPAGQWQERAQRPPPVPASQAVRGLGVHLTFSGSSLSV